LNGWHCAFLCFFIKKFTAPPASLQIAHKTDCKSRTILFKNQGVSAKSFQLAIISFQLKIKELQIFFSAIVIANRSGGNGDGVKQSFSP
jgi:hypothetical protein